MSRSRIYWQLDEDAENLLRIIGQFDDQEARMAARKTDALRAASYDAGAPECVVCADIADALGPNECIHGGSCESIRGHEATFVSFDECAPPAPSPAPGAPP